MLVKTYPGPSRTYEEVVCCAGIDAETRRWIRMYPVNFRSLDELARFRKWQFIDATWRLPHNDSRPESRRIEQSSIRAGAVLPAGSGWRERREWLDPIVDRSLEALKEAVPRRTLGVIRPKRISRLVIRPARGWDRMALENVNQLSFELTGSRTPPTALEVIPFDFVYRFECDDERCAMHEMEIFDWEAGQAYRNFRRRYGKDGWEAPFRAKWEHDLPAADLHLVLGTHSSHPNTWMIVGVLYPPHPKVDEGNRRSRRDRRRQEGSMTLPGFGLEAE
jgi:hypothetical protein